MSNSAGRIRFGDLEKEERKAVNKVIKDRPRGPMAPPCQPEIYDMLLCFKNNNYLTFKCEGPINAMYSCLDQHKDDVNPNVIASKWQNNLRAGVLSHFQKIKLARRGH